MKDLNVRWFKDILFLFLCRDRSFSKDEATFEVNLIINLGMANLIESSKTSKLENDLYIRTSRIGATKTLNRQARIGIAMSINKAINHSEFGGVTTPYK
jgi:hypothetical protein